MSRLLKVTALLLAALWLPATLHCQLEHLEFSPLFACADSGEAAHADDDACTDDACQTIESGQIIIAKSRLDLDLQPLLLICTFQFAPEAFPAPAADFSLSRSDETLPRERPWQFERRAALPARAPDLLNA